MTQIRTLFEWADKDKSGTVSWDEFATALQDSNKAGVLKVMDIDPTEARGLFVLLDTNDTGEVPVEEFMQGCLRLRGTARAIDLATMMYFNKRMLTWWKGKVGCLEEHMETVLGLLREAKKE